MKPLLKPRKSVLLGVLWLGALATVGVLGQSVKPVDPCSLLTVAEIQGVLGQPVQPGKLNANANPAVGAPCEYKVGSFGIFSILCKQTTPGETPERVKSELQKRKIAVSDAPGVGASSFFSSPGYGMIKLNTFKGDRYLIITLLIPATNEPTQKEAAKKLMQKALAKLP